MIRNFLKDRRGNYALATAIGIVPIMGALGLAVDYTDMSRQKAEVRNALELAGVATGRRVNDGATDEQLVQYAKDFFEANLNSVDPANATLYVTLPDSEAGGGLLKLSADFRYKPKFMPVFNKLPSLAKVYDDMLQETVVDEGYIDIPTVSEAQIRLRNTAEIALVMDNSGSMDYYGTGSSKKRITLMKEAATYLVNEITKQSAKIKQVTKPVQFSLVPFAASVNVGPQYDNASWMDTTGVSPVHHENFDWSRMNSANDPDKYVQYLNGVWWKRGDDWGDSENTPMTRFSLYSDIEAETSREQIGSQYVCTRYRSNGTCREGYYTYTYQYNTSQFASWQGCVEARPYPHNVDDTTASVTTPATMFVPMFAPDEAGSLGGDYNHDGDSSDSGEGSSNYSVPNSWWDDFDTASQARRQADMRKYFRAKPYGASSAGSSRGPNYSCTTNAITPLTDTIDTDGKAAVLSAINAMAPNGGTNVVEGMAWGWRTISEAAPFTEGRPASDKGNDKVIILLTDGDNTYYTPGSLGYNDYYPNRSVYSSYGYAGQVTPGESKSRIFQGTTVSSTWYDNGNYTTAMNQQFEQLCQNAKDEKVYVFTVGLDLPNGAAAIPALQNCASESRFRKNPDGTYKKLFFNTRGGDLLDVFKTIADELSNLRIVG